MPHAQPRGSFVALVTQIFQCVLGHVTLENHSKFTPFPLLVTLVRQNFQFFLRAASRSKTN